MEYEYGEYILKNLEKLNNLKELNIYFGAVQYNQVGWSIRYMISIGNLVRKLLNLEKLVIQDAFAFRYIRRKEEVDLQKKIDSERYLIEGLGYLNKIRVLEL